MKFLLDVNIPPSLGKSLKALGHSYRWVPDCMDPTSSDLQIIREATTTGEIILTHDTDFGTLLSFFATTKPSVVLFRIDKVDTDLFYRLLTENWASISQPLEEGALIIFQDDKFRVRSLPIQRR
ncbi:DUF5615 family PIN-like protein [Spirosoma arcticum]